ncbi:AtpZ/AtpI family protein [Halalkalibacter oceani]|uniref:AtpZ/AtpI family protein n=1 Tax=Halalkalibacter oceani TaxID=1653776 RepID=UPI0033970E81
MPDHKRSPWRAMVLVSIISSYIVGGVIGGVFFGIWLDSKFSTQPLFLISFLLLGLATGLYGTYRTIQPFLGDDAKK